jgi:hypothetical protein
VGSLVQFLYGFAKFIRYQVEIKETSSIIPFFWLTSKRVNSNCNTKLKKSIMIYHVLNILYIICGECGVFDNIRCSIFGSIT